MWSEEDLNEGERVLTYPVSPPKDSTHRRETVRAIMTKAVELAAARFNAMTDDTLRYALRSEDWGSIEREFALHGARLMSLSERLSASEESVRELTRRAQQAEAQRDQWQAEHGSAMRRWKAEKERADALEKRRANLSAAGQVLSEHVDKTCGNCEGVQPETSKVNDIEAYGLLKTGDDARYPQRHPHAFQDNGHGFCAWSRPQDDGECGYKAHQHRYPCSPTCTHDDARTPGHPERVKERSEAANDAAGKMHGDYADGFDAGLTRGYDDGAEAMRAACWEAVQHALAMDGFSADHTLRRILKHSIEGAVP